MFLSDIYKTDTLYFVVLETDLRVAKNRYLSWLKNRHWFWLNQNTMVFLSNVEAEVLYFLRWGMSEKL